MNSKAILLVDDHPIVREGYRRLIESRTPHRIVAEAESASEAYRTYRMCEPDLVVMDLSLPGPGGLEALRHIRQWDGTARILVFSMHQNPAYAVKAFEAGAVGYVTKSSDPTELLAAIEEALEGRRAMSSDIARELADVHLNGVTPLAGLSPRETEILRMIALGMTDEAIADGLSLSLKTVQNNHYRIRAKLDAPTDALLTHIAIEAGLLGEKNSARTNS
ncbi:two-component response regulator [Fulvimarina pelagi HTCC2506]|uniref:Two-component response regulator n=2 Tax=Fulvimarina pelagi TaxID=217511 RepID=Q0G063_9HYPH|nr:response regulator transcription factor [Fulvimarina pelagi]EAU40730.1 two-component response regulator [Fulvimarina pelagi HTCC2506]BAT31272.1 LuxR family transcriptional regulator [Fulvimarina pelagi]